MRQILLAIVASAVFASALWPGDQTLVYGQGELTEQFIPIGKSPGLSGKVTWIGPAEQINVQNNALTVKVNSGSKTFRVTDKTRIWLDRTKIQLTNIKGTLADLKPGRRVEINPLKDSEGVAEWIKIEIAQ